MVYIGEHVHLQRTIEKSRDLFLQFLHLPRELEILVNIPASGGEHFIGQFESISKRLGEAVELRLANWGKFDAGVFDFLDYREEFFDAGN